MDGIEKITGIIELMQDTLEKYEAESKISPESLFVKGILKNTSEQISELHADLAFEKQNRQIYQSLPSEIFREYNE